MKILIKSKLTMVVVSLIFLSACHKDNAFLKQDKALTKKALMSAQVVAAKKTHFYGIDGAFNYAYCIDHLNDSHPFIRVRCDQYMQAMLHNIVKKAGFDRVSLFDLKNKEVVHRLGSLDARTEPALAHQIIRSM